MEVNHEVEIVIAAVRLLKIHVSSYRHLHVIFGISLRYVNLFTRTKVRAETLNQRRGHVVTAVS
jgi:hypothetical protein